MTKKALSILVIACFYHFVLFAEQVASFSIPNTYLENGKVRLNATGSTSFKFTVSCLRGLVGGTNDYEPANIVVNLVAYHAGSNGAPVMTIIGGPYTIKTADFGASNAVTKTLDAVATYTNIQNETGITLIWSSYAFPNNNVWTSDYKFVPYTPAVPITNNTIAFNTPYVYMENIDIAGSTPTVIGGNYTFEWLVDDRWFAGYNVTTQTLNSLQVGLSSILLSGPHFIQRKITSATGEVNLSDKLYLTVPSTTATVNVIELPGNTKVGDNFVRGTVANLTVDNPVPGVKYTWYYNHWFAQANSAYEVLATSTSTNPSFIFTISPTRFPPTGRPIRPELIYVYGSDGTKATYFMYIN